MQLNLKIMILVFLRVNLVNLPLCYMVYNNGIYWFIYYVYSFWDSVRGHNNNPLASPSCTSRGSGYMDTCRIHILPERSSNYRNTWRSTHGLDWRSPRHYRASGFCRSSTTLSITNTKLTSHGPRETKTPGIKYTTWT